jgi:hypothetical protein
VPDSDSLQADACGPGYRWDMLTRVVLEAKEDMRRRGALSPDQCGGADLRAAGGAERFQSEDRVSAERVGVRGRWRSSPPTSGITNAVTASSPRAKLI